MTAGGSQLKINGLGIFSTTAAKFEVKAGQHLFKQGQKLTHTKLNLPTLVSCSNKLKEASIKGIPLVQIK